MWVVRCLPCLLGFHHTGQAARPPAAPDAGRARRRGAQRPHRPYVPLFRAHAVAVSLPSGVSHGWFPFAAVDSSILPRVAVMVQHVLLTGFVAFVLVLALWSPVSPSSAPLTKLSCCASRRSLLVCACCNAVPWMTFAICGAQRVPMHYGSFHKRK